MRPSPRVALGVPRGWEKNYFLEFAPNVRNLVDAAPRPLTPNPPKKKEDLLKEFFDEMGVAFGEPTKPKSLQKEKEEYAPTSWEVREQLRRIVREHEGRAEEKMVVESKYPVIVRGEIDPRLAAKSERKKQLKKEKDEKLQSQIDAAKQKKSEASQRRSTSENPNPPEAKVQKDLQKMYTTTRKEYHRMAAPTRFYK